MCRRKKLGVEYSSPFPGCPLRKKYSQERMDEKKNQSKCYFSPRYIRGFVSFNSRLLRSRKKKKNLYTYLYYNIISFYTIKTSNEPERSPIILYLVRSITLIRTYNITGRGRPNYKYVVSTVVL